ncbi:N-acetylmuramoyl-L-alanine amidase [Pseudonocardia aurantiaca]
MLCCAALAAVAAGSASGAPPVRPVAGAAVTAPAVTARGLTAPAAVKTPAAVPAPVSVTRAPVVVLDPGHNGRNGAQPGVISRPVPDGRGGTKPCNTTGTATNAGYSEHAFNFDVANRVAQRLKAAGVQVVLTRTDDNGVGPCVDERGLAGEKHAADAVVSIHADGSAAANSGFHVARSEPALNPAQAGPALALATALRDAMRAGGFRDSDYLGRQGLFPRPDLAGLNLATRPTALVECANMRNPGEAAVVSSPEGRERYAAAIAHGVLMFLGRGP